MTMTTAQNDPRPCNPMWDGTVMLGPSPYLRTSFNEHGMVLLQIDRGLIYTANRTGARIWQELMQGKAPCTIATGLNHDYGVPAVQAHQDTSAFINDLCVNGLLVTVEAGRL
jgi:Coenzyme PQQ synthesis protein D (PqqD)